MIFAFGFLAILLLGVVIYGLWQSSVRISRIQIFGADESLSSFATQTMRGSYLGIIPRDSIFFFPEARIRTDILATHPEIAAVSIFRNGFTGLSIKINKRVPIARWCGASPDAALDNCYLFDAKGFIYMTEVPTTTDGTSPSSPVNSFMVYESFAHESAPIGATLPNAVDLPSAFDFARQIATLGSPVVSISFRGDEVDDYLASLVGSEERGTRITYLLGDEQNAFTALVSALANLNLADGSLDYVDVRFDGKVYSKKK
jgi:hypothetical protein